MINLLQSLPLFELVLGGIIGYAISQLPTSASYIFRIFKPDRLLGTWYHHFANYSNKTVEVRVDTMVVSRGYTRNVVFTRVPINHGGDTYHGHIIREKNFLLTIARADRDNEMVMQRYKEKPVHGKTVLICLSLAQNYNGDASVNPVILCRKELSKEEFISIIKNAIHVDASNKIMYIR